MATVKVFMPTYRRNKLLQRSVQSLLDQSFTDWVCEVHNDDPDDNFPANYINSLNDDRFTIINHNVNLGPVKTFNLMFESTSCKYICQLEDDNWWEPEFLKVMTEIMDTHTNCSIGFSNVVLWQEETGDNWRKLPDPLWPVNPDKPFTFIHFPQARHVFNYHHSNCSMIIRNSAAILNYKVPENIRIDFIEAIRERAFPHPLLFVNQPLANFALTLETNRVKSLAGTYQHYILLVDSFFKNIPINDDYLMQLWADARQSKYRSYLKLIYAGLTCRSCRKLLAGASLSEWANFILYNIKHPSIFSQCLNAKKNYTELWDYLLTNTANRVSEANTK